MSDETLAPRMQRSSRKKSKRQLSLTLVYHPDTARIGTSCTFDVADGELAVSRQTPRFSSEDSLPREIGVAGVSRSPVLFEPTSRGWKITPPPRPGYSVDGQTIAVTYTDAQLERGVLVTLAGWVLIWVRTGPATTQRDSLGLVGSSRAMGRIRDKIRQVAPSDVPVLILGSSGAGKELVARAVHDASRRARQPYTTVNLAAVTGGAAVSQLFGHARGAFTGAAGAHRGFFQQSDRGTLLIDEIGEVQDEVQPLLLRALESGEIQPLGGATAHVDVRLIFSTDANLEQMVEAGKFRKALYYRMAQLVIRLPPLVDRPEDIAVQAVHFLGAALEQHGVGRRPLSEDRLWLTPEFMDSLLAHPWPGNSRELRAVMQRAVVQSAHLEQIGLDAGDTLRIAPSVPALAPPATTSVTESTASRARGVEPTRDELLAALKANDFQIGRAVKVLAIGRNRFYQLLKKYEVPTAKELAEVDIVAAIEATETIASAAEKLEVSERGLVLRMRALGLRE